jgi:hypothetical protein
METLGASNRQGAEGVRISGGGTGSHLPIPTAPAPTSPSRPEVETFAQSVHLFLAALFLAAIAQDLPAAAAGAMEAFGTLGRGSFSHDDKCFYPESAALGPIADHIGLLSTARRLRTTRMRSVLLARLLRSGWRLEYWSTSRGTTGCPFCCNRAAPYPRARRRSIA